MFVRVSRTFEWLEEGILVLLLAVMSLITFTQVVLRYVFGTGLLWGVELTGYLFGWLVLFGASYLLKKRGHIGVEVLVRLLPPLWQRAAGLLAVGSCLFYTAIMFIGGYEYVSTMHLLGVEAEDMPIQRWLLLIVIPMGFAMLIFRLIQIGWRIATAQDARFLLADEIANELAIVEEMGRDQTTPSRPSENEKAAR